MKLIAKINEEKHEVELIRDAGNPEKIFAKIDDREYQLDASEVEPNVYLFKHDNKIYQIFAAPTGIVNIGNRQLEINLIDPKRRRASAVDDVNTEGIVQIKTAMPGKVARILVKVGDSVAQGTGVIVVEAMKMQNEMKSPKEGVIKEIRVEEAATVDAGDVLVVIE